MILSMGLSPSQQPGPREVDAVVKSVLNAMIPAPLKGEPGRQPEVFAGRLLSQRLVEEFGSEVREVRIAPGTVITPLAKDFLRRAGIEVRWVARGEVDRVQNACDWGFAIERDLRSGLVDAFRRSLLDESTVWNELGRTVEGVARWVVEQESRGALLLTEDASVAVFRACQIAGVRPASTENSLAVARAVRGLGANLIVIEPAGKSIAVLRQMATTFQRAGGPITPDWIRTPGSEGVKT